ncbi:sensor histidine kinase [Cochleicola gelatinilyticus]|uniref:histidine kinase n=1 Tax=Cochleicola gelatinilyticus TaxID=1763537 RepID=A0A167J8G5_9FLAO|nr:PAS domain-containing sensor histidine kinase [Cochleicola gelatinilyticus]OAB80426.1 hypothetical protein ULVI_06735 [Cochleicola gelatinilyticus]
MNYLKTEPISDKFFLEGLLENQLSDGNWLVEITNPALCKASSSFWKSLGYSDGYKTLEKFRWELFIVNEGGNNLHEEINNFLNNHFSNATFSKEAKFIKKDGSFIWMAAKGRIVLDKNKNHLLFISFTDISKYKKKEESFQKKIDFHKQLIEGTNTGTWRWNPRTEELKINSCWANILGYTLEELHPITGETYRTLTHPDDVEKSTEVFQEHVEGKTPFYEFETRMKHKDGHWVWIRDKGKVISRYKDGTPKWIGGSHQEITQHKNDELQLSKYKDLLERSNEAARIGSWDIDLKNNNLTWSKTTKEIHEVNQDYIPVSQTALDFYKKGTSYDTIIQVFENCITKGEKYDVNVEIITAKGNHKWVRAIGIPVMDNGVCTRAYGLFQDIDRITKAQKQLEFKEKQLRLTFKNAANGMGMVDLTGKWMRVNKSLCKILGYTVEELLQLKFHDITHPEDLSKNLPYFNEMLSGERDHYKTEKRYLHKDGHSLFANLAVSIVRNEENQPLHFVAQITDISDKKKKDKKIKALLDVTVEQNKRLLNFAHIVSHNLRSHSGNFLMLLNLIEEEIPAHTQNVYFPFLKGNAENLSDTITGLNEVVKMSAHVNEQLKSVNLLTTIEGIISNLAPTLIQPDFLIAIDINEDITAKVIPAYLKSIILNLLTNAIKYQDTKKDSYLQIAASVTNNNLIISFKDNGLGIDMELYGSKIFGMYKTFHDNENSQGIGLFITKNQVETMGGTISVESAVGVGTTFQITLKTEEK